MTETNTYPRSGGSLLAVDGNSLTHRSFHALRGTDLRDRHGRPTWAIKGFINQLLGAIERVNATAVMIAFDDAGNNARKRIHPEYKAQRSEKDPDLRTQLALLPELLTDAGLAVEIHEGLEADDLTAAASSTGAQHGWHTTIVTSDRDSFSHISEHTSVLHVINGGIENSPVLTPQRLALRNNIRPEQYLDYAAVRGDTSDNLPGVRGIGEKTAAKLLEAFGSMAEVWADVDDIESQGAQVAAVAGKAAVTKLLADGAREAWLRNRHLMSPMPATLRMALHEGPGHLPVDPTRLEAALRGFDLAVLRSSALRVLAHHGGPSARQPVLAPAEMDAPPLEDTGWAMIEPEDSFLPPFEDTFDAAAAAQHPAAQVVGF